MAIAVAASIAPAQAQMAATLPASSSVYEHLEAIAALLPRPGLALGQCPMSRRELYRVVAALVAQFDRSASELSPADRAIRKRTT